MRGRGDVAAALDAGSRRRRSSAWSHGDAAVARMDLSNQNGDLSSRPCRSTPTAVPTLPPTPVPSGVPTTMPTPVPSGSPEPSTLPTPAPTPSPSTSPTPARGPRGFLPRSSCGLRRRRVCCAGRGGAAAHFAARRGDAVAGAEDTSRRRRGSGANRPRDSELDDPVTAAHGSSRGTAPPRLGIADRPRGRRGNGAAATGTRRSSAGPPRPGTRLGPGTGSRAGADGVADAIAHSGALSITNAGPDPTTVAGPERLHLRHAVRPRRRRRQFFRGRERPLPRVAPGREPHGGGHDLGHRGRAARGWVHVVAVRTPASETFQAWVAAPPWRRCGYSVETSRGAAAATTWIVRGDESRRRRGCDVDIPWRRVAPPLRQIYSVWRRVAATTRMVRGRNRRAQVPREQSVLRRPNPRERDEPRRGLHLPTAARPDGGADGAAEPQL